MVTKKGKKLLVVILAAALMAEPVAQQTVYAQEIPAEVQQEADISASTANDQAAQNDETVQTESDEKAAEDNAQESLEEESEAEEATPQLQDGTAVIPQGADETTVKEILGQALVANADQVDIQSLEWEYYCEGKTSIGISGNASFGSISGFTSETGKLIKTKYTHPAFADNGEGDYQIRLKGSDETVTVHRVYKLSSSIVLADGAEVGLKYNDDGDVDYDALRESIFQTIVQSISPDLTCKDVEIKYYAKTTSRPFGSFVQEWMPLEGGKSAGLTYPAISAGTYKIQISYAGNDMYHGTTAETEVTVGIGKNTSVIVCKENPTVKLVYKDDLSVDYDAVKAALFAKVVDVEQSSPANLTAENLTIEYYATATTGAVGSLGHAWVPVEGGKVNGLTYPGIPEGAQKVRYHYAGDKENTAVSVETEVQIQGREESSFTLKDAPYEVGMAFHADQSYDYEATAKAIYEAVVAETNPENIGFEDVTLTYNAGADVIKNWKPLDTADWSNTFSKFGPGEWTIRIVWDGNKEYKGTSVEVKVTTEDNRIASAIVCKEGASFTYNMDAAAMKQEMFDQLIDWENSTLPEKDSLSVDDFTMEYYGSNDVSGIDGGVNQWAPIEGGTVNLLTYLQMGAGEQKVRLAYKGNADYRPSVAAEGTVTVNKAKVKVKVKTTNIYAGDAIPEGFVTTDPADKFDVYTVYAGMTSNVTAGIYLELPEKYTNSAVLKVLDPVMNKVYGKSFTQMMQDGMTVGELRKLFSTQELLDVLKKLNIDTGTFGQLLEVINKLPSVADSVRVSFGTPNRAGLYTVAAITDNKNYKTGVGMGTLLVRMHLKGVKLTWNQNFANGKISAADAADFDFKASLSSDGDVSISQDNVHYLYSGFTSKWKPYSSTTTPPTEPGRYVVTVVTLGGNYQAAPITRSFQITK